MKLLPSKIMRSTGLGLLAATGVVLLVAGVSKKNNKECTDVKVEVTGVNRNIFIDEKEVLKLLNANGNLVGMPVAEINLQVLEKRLENDKWIRNAELFFDNNEVLEVKVEEREPLARIFTTAGSSFYIDSSTSRLPLSDKMSVRVPMFTNFPANAKKLRARDSALLASVKELATYIQADSFWNAQVAQVNITADRTFEIIPTIGDHIVLFGKGKDIDQKFKRLMSFYKQVWTKVGLEKYAVIDVQYKGQVVATRRGAGIISVDSSKAKEAFIELLNASKPETLNNGTVEPKHTVEKEKSITKEDEPLIAKPLTKKEPAKIARVESKVKEDKSSAIERPTGVKDKKKEPTNDKKPKAIMSKKT
jgi:cell division protein FtsQ